MLLDRKKVKFWQKIIFGFMAFLMVGFGISISAIMGAFPGCGAQGPASAEERIEELQVRLEASPSSAATLLALAEAYQQVAAQEPQGSDRQITAWDQAAQYQELYVEQLEEAVKGSDDPADINDLVTAYETLGSLYTNLGDVGSVVTVYGKLTDLVPNDADNYLFYGQAAQNAGQTDLAILAYRKYLELEPDSQFSDDVRALLEELTGEPVPAPSPTDGG